MLGVIGILATAKRLLGVFLQIKNNGLYAESSIGNFPGAQNVLTPNEWNHVAMSVSNNIATFFVNGGLAGGSPGSPPPATFPSVAKLQNVNYLRNTSVNINANSYLGANNKTFIDKSPVNSTILTTSGALVASGVTLGSFSPYSNQEWSMQVGASNFLSAQPTGDQFAFYNSNFTIEFWAYSLSAAGEQVLFDIRNPGTGNITIYISTTNTLCVNVNGTITTSLSNFSILTWNHIAFVNKSDSGYSLYLNGTQLFLKDNVVFEPTDRLSIGRNTNNLLPFNGYISNVRVLRGTALYNNNFTPSNQALKLLPAKEITSGSVIFPFDNSLLSSNKVNFNLGMDNFAVEMWVYKTKDVDSYKMLIDNRILNTASDGLFYYINPNNYVQFHDGRNLGGQSLTQIELNTWYHLRFTRDNEGYKLYINGVLECDGTFYNFGVQPYFNNIKDLSIGQGQAGSSRFYGYISNLRIVKGSTIDYPEITIPTSSLKLEGVSAENSIGIFNGSTTYLSAQSPNLSSGSSNFTIECWAYFNSTATSTTCATIFDMRSATTGEGFQPTLVVEPLNSVNYRGRLVYWTNSQRVIVSNFQVATGNWYHIALVKNSNTTSLYVDGLFTGSATDTNTYNPSSIHIGVNRNRSYGYLNGYLSNFRIVTGAAVYTTQFTRPSSYLTPIPGTVLLTLKDPTLKDNSIFINTLRPLGGFTMSQYNYLEDVSKNYYSIRTRGTGCALSSKYIDPPISLGSSDYTVEFFLYVNEKNATSVEFFKTFNTDGNQNTRLYLNNETKLYVQIGSTAYYIFIKTILPKTWYHIALVKTYGKISIFINGKLTKTTSNSQFKNTLQPTPNIEAGLNLDGYITEYRIVNKAQYYIDFTPPTEPLTVIGEPQTYEYSGLFDGTTTYLSARGTGIANFLTGAFTIEFWIFIRETKNQNLIEFRTDATSWTSLLPAIYITNAGIIYFRFANLNDVTTPVAVNTWYHIALTRTSAGVYTFYKNGTSVGTYTNPSSIASSNLVVGVDCARNYPFNGYMSNLRIVDRVQYSGNFTVPTSSLPIAPGTKLLTLTGNVIQDGAVVDSSGNFAGATKLAIFGNYIHSVFNPFNYTDKLKTHVLISGRNNSIKDYSLFNLPISGIADTLPHNQNPWLIKPVRTTLLTLTSNNGLDASGHITLSSFNISFSAVDPFDTNGYSAVLTGGPATASSCLSARTNGFFVNDDDFTLEFWFYPRKKGSQVLFDTRTASSTDGYAIYINSNNRIAIVIRSGTETITGPSIDLNKWHHFAMTRKAGQKVEFFLNKKYIGNANTIDTTSNFNPVNNLVIGTDNARAQPLSGLISNFRIIKGKSLYNFQNEKLFDVPTNDAEIITVNPTTYSQYFNTSSYVSAGSNAEFVHGLSSFTIEMWIKPRTNTDTILFDARNNLSTGVFNIWRAVSSTIIVRINNSTTTQIESIVLTPLNKWSHIAVSRQQGVGMTLYVNGISAGFFNDSLSAWNNNTNLTIGASQVDAGYKFDGLISNVRVVKNAALYSGATINVPTEPLSLYNSYDLDKYSTVFNSNKKTFISIPTSTYPGFNWGTGSFCVEFFLYPHNINKLCTIFDSRDLQNTSGNYLKIERSAANKIVCSVAGAAKITSTQNISAGAWYHIVYERIAGVNSKLYINGVSQGIYADSLISYEQIKYVYIGASTTADGYDGLISNLRISNNAPYVGNVSVPTSNFTSNANTQLLLFQDDQLIDRGINNIQGINYFGPTSYLTTNVTNPFYPSNGVRTILLTLQDSSVKDNAGFFTEGNTLQTGALSSESNNPFNSAVSTVFLGLKSKDDFKSYGLSAQGSASYSITNPFDGDAIITSFLLNGGLYKDSSTYNTPIYNTSVTQRPIFTNFSPFLNLTPYTSANGGSVYFDSAGSTKFLLVSSKGLVTSFGSKEFTIEFWVYKNSTASSQMTLFDTTSSTAANSPGHMQIYLNAANNVVFYMGGAARITSTLPIPSYSWQHIAVTRKASNFYLYINGKLAAPLYGEVNTDSVSSNFTDPKYFSLGSSLSPLNTNTFVGYMTDIHVVSGQCLYKSEFSPPIEPLSAFANSTLLINATNAGIVDTTGKFSLFTGGTGVYISDDVPPISASASTGTLSAGSMYFDGTSSSYVYTDVASNYFSLTSYTAELWVKPTITPSTSGVLFSIRASDTDKIVLSIDSARRVVYRSTNSTAISSITASTPLVLSSWNHIVVTRALSSGSLTTYKTNLYVNGTDAGFISAAATATNKILNIGSDNNNNRFTGYIDDFKIVKEVMSRYASNVTLPIRESEIHNNLRYPSVDHLEETKLLLNADSTQAIDNNTLSDSSDNLLSVSKTGTVYQGSHTILSPGFGYNPATHGGSIYLDGSSDVYINDLAKAQLKPFNFTNNYTIEAWVKPLNAGSNPPIFDTRKKGVSAVIGSNYNATSRFKGYITGVKASKNISRYSNNFTVNMIPPVSDQYTSLLLNFNKAGIYDSVSKNNIATIGTAKISREHQKFGEGSIYFDGGGYLAIPENDHFKVANLDFTLEWYMKATNTYVDYGVFTTTSPDNSANGNLYVNFRNNSLYIGVYGAMEIDFPTCSGAQDEWVHIAIVRENGYCRAYRNGVLQGEKSFPIDITTQNGAFIGKTYNMPMYGYIDEFRFTNGVCRYTANSNPNPEQSMAMLYDANDNAYNVDDTTTILNPPRYPSSNTVDDYLAANNNNIMVDCVLVGGGGAGGNSVISSTVNNSISGIKCGGGGGGAVITLSFRAKTQELLNIVIGAGGTANYGIASTNGNNSFISGYISLSAMGGGSGGSFYNPTLFFPAGSGSSGGGAFFYPFQNIENVPGRGVTGLGFDGSSNYPQLSAGGGGGGAGSLPIDEYARPINIINQVPYYVPYGSILIGSNNGGKGLDVSFLNNIYLSSFGGGGQGSINDKVVVGGGGTSGAISTLSNKWGGGGLYRSTLGQGRDFFGGSPGAANMGGGGGGGSYSNGNVGGKSIIVGGNGGSGCAIFSVPAILNDFFQTTGTVERITVGDYTFIIFKSSGTLQLV